MIGMPRFSASAASATLSEIVSTASTIQSMLDKKGKKEKLFYKEMIALAEQTYDDYLFELIKEQENEREI